MNFRTFGARCIVEEIKNENVLKSGIILQNADKEPTYRGIVIAVGDGAVLENGQKVPMQVAVGDEVIYTTFSGTPIQDGDKSYLILNERDILCVIDK
jgi:chaperonin GroES